MDCKKKGFVVSLASLRTLTDKSKGGMTEHWQTSSPEGGSPLKDPQHIVQAGGMQQLLYDNVVNSIAALSLVHANPSDQETLQTLLRQVQVTLSTLDGGINQSMSITGRNAKHRNAFDSVKNGHARNASAMSTGGGIQHSTTRGYFGHGAAPTYTHDLDILKRISAQQDDEEAEEVRPNMLLGNNLSVRKITHRHSTRASIRGGGEVEGGEGKACLFASKLDANESSPVEVCALIFGANPHAVNKTSLTILFTRRSGWGCQARQ